ncbi:MAG TPA: D-alanyl-D-alanine carboxypeptidase family protein [Caulobacteraceae bacterium]|jgi:LAS superfamily LD-carboxypeptidase LdcB
MSSPPRFLAALAAAVVAAVFAWTLAPAQAAASPYATCGDAPKPFVDAAVKNAESIDTLEWAPFGPHEKGWAIYEILIGQEIGTTCGAGTAVFAQKLADFQAQYHVTPDGVFSPATFDVFKGVWQERRPFVMLRVQHLCPDTPSLANLKPVPPSEEAFDRDDRALRADVLAAYQQMLAAARRESGAIAANPDALKVFSGYRDPASDAARCETEHNCDGAHRASCSAHRTGTAIDLDVGNMQGVHADDATTDNRMLQTRTAAYRWMVANANRFGFVNYAFEPWHWEYVKGPLPATAPPEPILTNAATAPPATSGPQSALTATTAASSAQGAVVTLPTAKPLTDPAKGDTPPEPRL